MKPMKVAKKAAYTYFAYVDCFFSSLKVYEIYLIIVTMNALHHFKGKIKLYRLCYTYKLRLKHFKLLKHFNVKMLHMDEFNKVS